MENKTMYVIEFPVDKKKRYSELERERTRRICAEAEAEYWKYACNMLFDLHFGKGRRQEMLRAVKEEEQ